MTRDQLFAPVEPYETGDLQLDRTHLMYWEQSGNPNGIPALFLHGGPGAGATAVHRRFFDPDAYRIVIYDQRGAGRSEPRGELADNTTQHLIDDIERLRTHLGIDKWLLFGGSWGSTLALAYGEAHPDRVLAMVLRGIFLGRPHEIQWFLYGLRTVFPEVWRDFVSVLPEEEHGDVLHAFHRRLTDPDPEIHLPAARAWSRYEGACSTLLPSPETVAAFSEDAMAFALARIETHYFVNDVFLPPDALLGNIARLRKVPAAIVQGRYDMVCPVVTADELHRAWPEANYTIVPDSGHSAMDGGIRAALVRATETFKRRL